MDLHDCYLAGETEVDMLSKDPVVTFLVHVKMEGKIHICPNSSWGFFYLIILPWLTS